MRPPSPGRPASPAVRIVISALPFLFGSLKLPVYVPPACSVMVSPDCALLMAVCRLPPAATSMVAAIADDVVSSNEAQTRAATKEIRMNLSWEAAIGHGPEEQDLCRAS